jgi:hypothetical protein
MFIISEQSKMMNKEDKMFNDIKDNIFNLTVAVLIKKQEF